MGERDAVTSKARSEEGMQFRQVVFQDVCF